LGLIRVLHEVARWSKASRIWLLLLLLLLLDAAASWLLA
jgi:hypothetical protein